MASGRKKVSSPKKFSWGFCLVMCFMLGVTAFLIISSGSRFSGAAWRNLMEHDSEDVSVDGFMAVDLSDTIDPDMKRTAAEVVSMQGAAFAAQMPGKSDTDVFLTDKNRQISHPLPLEASASVKPELSETKSADTARVADPKPPVVKVASLPLPVPTEEFGPLPKDLADFESIILNTKDDGMRLPDDSLGDLPDMELPDEDIILSEVGPGWQEHIVKAGETLSDIVMQYSNVTAQDILRANGLKDANRLATDQILLIPNSPDLIEDTLAEVRTRQARVAALREQVVPLKIISYVVATGDSLWSIANSQNLEVDTLVGSNTFKSSAMLHPGVVLRIPNQDGIFYKLKSGETIEVLARRYQVSVDKIRKVNPTVDLASLKAGSEIFLPGARPEAIAEVHSVEKKSTSNTNTTVSTQRFSRVYRWPVMGKINSPFGWRRHPITRRRDFHTGIDIKASRGTAIRCAREGKVVYSGWMGGYGKVLVVEHSGGQSTLYAHCNSLLVKQGAHVSVGQNIATVGSTGRTTGPHLHFEVRVGNSPVNPLKYLR